MGSFTERAYRLKTAGSVIVRSARADDALAVLAHGRAVVDEGEFVVTCPEEFNFTEKQERDWISQYVDEPGKLLLVAEASRQIIGVLFIESAQRKRLAHHATVHMSVEKGWRSQGVGMALLQSAVDWASSHPIIEKLCLAVFATNNRAIGLYRKLGFVEEGRRLREIKFGSERYVDDILMYRFVNGTAD